MYEQILHLLDSARKEHCADPWAYSSALFALNEAQRYVLGCGLEVLELMIKMVRDEKIGAGSHVRVSEHQA